MAQPTNAREAELQAELAREAYQNKASEITRLGSTTERANELASLRFEIERADNDLNKFLVQDKQARLSSTSSNDLAARQTSANTTVANQQREEALAEVQRLRNSNAPEYVIREAEAKAFDAERNYQVSRDSSIVAADSQASFLSELFNPITSLPSTIGNAFNNFGIPTPDNASTTNNTTMDVMGGGGDRRIRIRPKSGAGNIYNGILSILADTNGMMFPYTPNITYSGTVNYAQTAPTHANQDYHAYTNTPALQISIAGNFTAQNPREGEYMLACIHFLRTVSKMRFGQSSNRGLPPPVLLLSGYGDYMFNDLPVIVNNYSMEMVNTVDLVDVTAAGGVTQVPALSLITVTLTVQQTPNKQRQFDWDQFASGSLMKRGGWI